MNVFEWHNHLILVYIADALALYSLTQRESGI